jgi:dipeptidase E
MGIKNMKLFLSSGGVPRPDLLKELLGITNEKVRVALINNAQDLNPENIAAERSTALSELFVSLGFQPVNVDLREYETKKEKLVEKIKACKLIWCSGGNAFWLRYVMHTSGFDTIIRGLLSEGIVYGGWSAGIVLVGPSLHPIELMDESSKVPTIIMEGLNLTDFFIWPHWDNPKYIHLQAQALEEMKLLPYESVTLKDGEVIIVEDGEKRIVR